MMGKLSHLCLQHSLSPVLDVTIKWCLHSKAPNWFVKYIVMKYFM